MDYNIEEIRIRQQGIRHTFCHRHYSWSHVLSQWIWRDTIESALEQVERLTGRKINVLAGDRGYRGRKEINGTKIILPDVPKKSDSRYQKLKKQKLFCKRAGIEPTIGHLKSDYRLGRNFYKGVVGDTVNVLLAAAAYNFKRAMKALWCMLQKICEIMCQNNISQKLAF